MSTEKYDRNSPYTSHLIEKRLLTKEGSSKKTYHLSLAIDPDLFSFDVGDSVAIFVENHNEEIDHLLYLLQKKGSEKITDPRSKKEFSLKDYLLKKVNITKVSPNVFKSLVSESDLKEEELKSLQDLPLTDLLEKFCPSFPIDVTKLLPLLPRFYSIANSPLFFKGEIHLTISYLTYMLHGKEKKGIASQFLCDQALLYDTPISIYLQKTTSFLLPEDPNASIIMVGPGTGIAPFRAFLQQRLATQQEGKNWLFFGERNQKTDFYYEDFFLSLQKENRLRLNLAFSRDQEEKIYVQHEMLKEKKSLWHWIEKGAYLYVCGDAEKMAKDVDLALLQILMEEGTMSIEEARSYLKQMRHEKRYRIDVY